MRRNSTCGGRSALARYLGGDQNMRKRTSLAAASSALAITAALSIGTAGLAAASPVPLPATGAGTSASTATTPMQPARPASGLMPSARAITNNPSAAAKKTPPVRKKPALHAAKTSARGVTPALTAPTTAGHTCLSTDVSTAQSPAVGCDTPVTFTVSSGNLSISVPALYRRRPPSPSARVLQVTSLAAISELALPGT